ncbi:hypothetical protein GCM10020218_083950 [Dactylosporangium vinaceum]
MHIRLLGPVGIAGGGELRTVAGERRTTVLAVLALAHGEVVSTDRLIDAVWGADPPATAQNTLQQHVSYLRRALGDAGTIAARPPGYVLTVAGGGDPTDAARADRLIRATADTDDPRERVRLLREAVALWHGRPLAGAAGLDEDAERLHTVWLRAQVALGRGPAAAGASTRRSSPGWAGSPPTIRSTSACTGCSCSRSTAAAARTRPWARPGGCARPSAPTSASTRGRGCATWRRRSAGATRPSTWTPPRPRRPARSRPSCPSRCAGSAAGPASWPASASSPPRPARSSPRSPARPAWARRASPSTGPRPPPAATPTASSTSICAASTPAAPPPNRPEALRGFLGALNGPETLPDEPDELAARFRGSVAGRRVLVVLDNARDAEQVRPLLPESGRSMTLITSRTSLTPPGARPLALDLLGPAESRDLLAGRLGPDRVAAEPDAADEIIARCARLPLALAVAAAQVATRPGVSLAEQAAQLRDAAGRLDALDGGDPATDVQAVFSWSYRALSPAAARLFRLLGLHPGPDLTAPGAASLAGEPLTRTQSRLRALLHANLLAEPVPGRYALHDLLKAYAIRRSHTEDTGEDRRAAVHRVLDHHLHTAHAAALLIDPGRRPLDPPAPVAGLTVPRLGDPVRALAWFEANHRVLTAAVRLAADEGFDVHAWQLPWTMTTYLDWRGHRPELIAAQTAALAVMQRIGEVPGRAGAHREIGRTLHRLGRAAEAAEHLAESVRLYAALGDGIGEARARYSAGMLASAAGRPDAARAEFGATLALAEAAGDLLWQGRTLTALSWAWVHSGDLDRALRLGDRAQALLQRAGDRHGEAFAWSTNAGIHHRRGDYEAATRAHRQAIRLMHDFGDRASHAGMLAELGDTCLAAGDPPGAADAWRRALHLYEQLGDPAADEIRRRLAAPPV